MFEWAGKTEGGQKSKVKSNNMSRLARRNLEENFDTFTDFSDATSGATLVVRSVVAVVGAAAAAAAGFFFFIFFLEDSSVVLSSDSRRISADDDVFSSAGMK